MKITIRSGDAARAKTPLLVVPLFDTDLTDKKSRPALLAALNKDLRSVLDLAQAEGFKARAEQTWTVHAHGKLRAQRVMLVGLGARAKFEPEVLRLGCGRAVKAAGRLRTASLTLALPVTRDFEQCLRAAAEGLLLGGYRYDRFRTVGKEEKGGAKVGAAEIILPPGQDKSRAVDEVLRLAEWTAEGVNWSRDLVNEPAGTLTPEKLADEARTLGKLGLKVTVRGRAEIDQLKMGMFSAVAQGSAREPQFIEVNYVPRGDGAKVPTVAFVGKGLTFDSGGLSLKPADGMVDMKTDMAGAAAVLGAMRVISRLKPPFPVTGYVGACENMPSGTAYRPGDVLISRRGKTVEITNTDAEGRLVLGDVLTYASEQKPALLIDLATLTGACIVALGNYIAGAFSDDDPAAWAVLEAAKAAGEEVWRMPLTDLQKDALRSEIADMKNSGERWGGAINAALFLREFVVDVPWVHLDIAGPSQSPKERGYHNKGATGVGVRTLVELVRRRAAEAT
jgi:leucyl aminopeptidase